MPRLSRLLLVLAFVSLLGASAPATATGETWTAACEAGLIARLATRNQPALYDTLDGWYNAPLIPTMPECVPPPAMLLMMPPAADARKARKVGRP